MLKPRRVNMLEIRVKTPGWLSTKIAYYKFFHHASSLIVIISSKDPPAEALEEQIHLYLCNNQPILDLFLKRLIYDIFHLRHIADSIPFDTKASANFTKSVLRSRTVCE